MRYYFSWLDLQRKAKSQNDGIVLLAYAGTFGYGKTVASYTNEIMTALKINRIDYELFNRYFRNENNRIRNLYKCELPQSYFLNKDFLTAGCTPRQKVEYLYLLGMRKNSITAPSIPRRYLDNDSLLRNPFIKVENEQIVFIMEANALA